MPCRASLLMLLAMLTTLAARVPVSSPQAVVLTNANGMEVHLIPTGAAIQRLLVPDASGQLADVVLGFDDEQAYWNGTNPQAGSIVGRVGGRIANAAFELDGQRYTLYANAGNDTLHGGRLGFDKRHWSLEEHVSGNNGSHAVWSYTSPDGEEGFPGQVNVTVRYSLPWNDNQLTVEVSATTTSPTPIAVYGHPYFNLGGAASGTTALNHELTMPSAAFYAPYVEGTGTPTGELAPVNGTVFDFQSTHSLGERIKALQESYLGGYDNIWALFGVGPDAKDIVRNFSAVATPGLAATLLDPVSGRGVELWGTSPAIIVYTGNWLNTTGKDMAHYGAHSGVAIELAQFPNAINTPSFPSVVLRPGEEYKQAVSYVFFAREPAPPPAAAPAPTPMAAPAQPATEAGHQPRQRLLRR